MKTTIYVVRHGESEANAGNEKRSPKIIKKGGSPLSKKGIEQAHRAGNNLQEIEFNAIYSSQLERANHTAKIIASKQNKLVKTEISIHERFWGSKYAIATDEERKKIRKLITQFEDEEVKMNFKVTDDGESALQAAQRLKKFLKKLTTIHPEQQILIVAHGNLMRAFLVHMGWAKYNELPHGAIENTGYFVVESDGERIAVKNTVGVTRKSL